MISGWWFVYGMAVSLLLGMAALVGEAALRAAGRPVRWAWATALVGSFLVPMGAWLGLLPRWLPAAPASEPVPPEPVALAVEPSLTGDVVLNLAPVTPAVAEASWMATGPLLVALWLLLTVVLALGLAASLVRLDRLSRRWRDEVVDGVPVRVSKNLGPAVIGLVLSDIVVPEWALGLEQRIRRLMLLHEREHQAAGDTQLTWLGIVCLVLMPWNLPLWWQVRRLRLAVEMDCDARVLRREPDRRAYGALLLEVGRRRSGLGPLAIALAEPPSALERRISLLASYGRRPRIRQAFALGAVAGLLAMASCWLEDPSEPAPPSAAPDLAVEAGGQSGAAVAESAWDNGRAIRVVRTRELPEAEAADTTADHRPSALEPGYSTLFRTATGQLPGPEPAADAADPVDPRPAQLPQDNPIADLPPPAQRVVDVSAAPTFTPMTIRPELQTAAKS
jgi:beta-lactamase regulating signal transducer with metallopeptidase domain